MIRQTLNIITLFCFLLFSMTAGADNVKLMNSYKCEGHKYDYQGQNWNTSISWTTEPRVEPGLFGDTKVFYNLFPTEGVFESSFGLEYREEGNKLIFEPTVLTFYGEEYIVCAVDADDLRAGGTGAIVLEVGADGSLSFPAGRKNHSYGYFICSIKKEELKPADVMYPLLMVSGVTFTGVEDEPMAELTGEVREVVLNRNAYWADCTADEGWFQIYGSNDDYLVTIDANTTHASGEFTDEQLDDAYTYISVWDGKEYKKIKSAESKAKITIDDKTGVVVGELWVREWSTGIVWHATLTHDPAKPEPMTYDEDKDVDVVFLDSDITSLNYENGAYVLRACNDNMHILDLRIYADGQESDIMIPEGIYKLSLTGENGTVQASSGVIGSSVTQSYVATVDSEGYIDKLWFLVQGNVTVKKNMVDGKPVLGVEIDAINSLCQKVKVVLGTQGAGISNVVSDRQQTAVRKIVNKGRLVIKTHNGMFAPDGKIIEK